MKTLSAVLIVAVVGFTVISCSKAPPTEPSHQPLLSEELQNALNAGLNREKGKGISAAVIMPDGWTWIGVSGVSHGTTPLTSDMRFSAGSIGKIFTAVTILQLAEEGRLSLEAPISRWLPTYPHIDSTITIRQLLNHTGGVNDFVDNKPAFWDAIFNEPSRVWTPDSIIREFNGATLFPKGSDWNYSTTGYVLLRMIIQRITGSGISAVNNSRFWVPFGLSKTSTSMQAELPSSVAHGWWDFGNDGTYEDFSSWPRTAWASCIAGEVWSTAEDLAKWARALFHDKRVLIQTSLDQMLAFYSPCTGEEYFAAGYGLGVVKYNPQLFNGLYAIGHSGNAPGYSAASIYLPDLKVCIGLVDNTDAGESVGFALNNLLRVITTHLNN